VEPHQVKNLDLNLAKFFLSIDNLSEITIRMSGEMNPFVIYVPQVHTVFCDGRFLDKVINVYNIMVCSITIEH
jgi:hypothetical protein